MNAIMEPLQLRTPPSSIEAEQCVLGAVLLDNSAMDRIHEIVSVKDFFQSNHRKIFEALQKQIERGQMADVMTLAEQLKGQTDCGLGYLGELCQATPSSVNVRNYAKIVREKSIQRLLMTLCTEVIDTVYSAGPRDVSKILDDLEGRIFDLRQKKQSKSTDLRGLLSEVLEEIDQRYHSESNDGITGLATGFVELDQMTAGLQSSDLIIVAGRPSMGKTAIAMNIAEHAAVKLGLPVLVFSLEMSDKQLAKRMLGSVARVDQQKMKSGKLTDDDWHRLTTGVGKLHDAPIMIEETSGLTIGELRARARRAYRERGRLGLIVVDYIGLMVAPGETRAIGIGDVSRGLKALAKELDVPVMALSQLNRALDARQNKRPMMSDLRDSGAIEQDADLILFMYRDEGETDDGTTEVIIGKQRSGPTGTVRLTFLKQFTRFENLAIDYQPPVKKKRERGFSADRAPKARADIDN